jgi:hypothetical protein
MKIRLRYKLKLIVNLEHERERHELMYLDCKKPRVEFGDVEEVFTIRNNRATAYYPSFENTPPEGVSL